MPAHEKAPALSGDAAEHAAGGSYWPILLAIGLALLLTGLVLTRLMVILGALLSLAATGLWIRDARREFRHLTDRSE